MVFIYQILWTRDQLANQAKPKNYPSFTHPVSNSNASPTNNILPVRRYVTTSVSRFTTPPITIFVQSPVPAPTDQNDPMDLSAFKGPKKLFIPEERKYRFDNNFYCGKPGHRIMDHKSTTKRVNFVTPAPIVTSPTKTLFAIETPPVPQQQKKT